MYSVQHKVSNSTVRLPTKLHRTQYSLKQIKRQNESETQQNLKHEVKEYYCKPAIPRYHLSAAAHYSQYSNGANRHQHQWRSDQYPSTSRWVTSHAHNTPRREENLCQTKTQVRNSKRETASLSVERKWRALNFLMQDLTT